MSKGGTAARARGAGAAGCPATGFSPSGGAEATGGASPEGVGATAPAAAAVGLSLLAAQEGGGRGAGRDAAARRRAASILDELNGLQAELLGGRADPARLVRLAALGDGEDGTDPGLRETVRAAALRARVELARRAAAPPPNRTTTVR